jgi:hypothetical protein
MKSIRIVAYFFIFGRFVVKFKLSNENKTISTGLPYYFYGFIVVEAMFCFYEKSELYIPKIISIFMILCTLIYFSVFFVLIFKKIDT